MLHDKSVNTSFLNALWEGLHDITNHKTDTLLCVLKAFCPKHGWQVYPVTGSTGNAQFKNSRLPLMTHKQTSARTGSHIGSQAQRHDRDCDKQASSEPQQSMSYRGTIASRQCCTDATGQLLKSADLSAYPSITKGRSNNTPFTSGAAHDMQLESSSPLPPPTSMMHLAACHAYASFSVCVPPCKLCCVKYVMDCINSAPKAAFSGRSPYCSQAAKH